MGRLRISGISAAVVLAGCASSGTDPVGPTAGGVEQAKAETAPTTSSGLDLELVDWNDDLEPGVTYRYPLFIHCGMQYLANFNGTHWYLTDAPHGTAASGSPGSLPEGWPIEDETIDGMVRLTDETTIEFSIPEVGVIGVYEASPSPPPDCM